MTHQATYLGTNKAMRGDARHYRLTPPLEGHEHVIVSAVHQQISDYTQICETYIFPANEAGKVTSYGELPGSYQGDTDHAKALRGAGYEVTA